MGSTKKLTFSPISKAKTDACRAIKIPPQNSRVNINFLFFKKDTILMDYSLNYVAKGARKVKTPILGVEWVLVPGLLWQHNVYFKYNLNELYVSNKKKKRRHKARRFSPSNGVIPCGITHSTDSIVAN